MERSHQQAQLALTKFSYAFEQLQRALRPVLSAIDALRSSNNEEELDAMSRARMHISLAYAVNSLFCMYLRTQGIDPTTHPIREEILRVQDAFMRMRRVEAGESTAHTQMPKRDRRKHIVNAKKSAAKLAALVFPEEDDLLRALQGKKRRPELEEAETAPQNEVHDNDKQEPAHPQPVVQEKPQLERITEKEQEKKHDGDNVILIESDDEPQKLGTDNAQEHSKEDETANHQQTSNEEQETRVENTKLDSEKRRTKKKKKKDEDRKEKDRKEKDKKKRKKNDENHDTKKKEKHARSHRKQKEAESSKERKKRRHSESNEAVPVTDKRERKKWKRNKKRNEST